MDLRGKRAFVTGATAGIGQAIATQLAAAGVHVIINGRRRDRLDRLARSLGADVACFDVADRSAVAAHFHAHPEHADVDILVNNAGLARGTDPMHAAHPDDWAAMLDTNVGGLLWMTRPIVARMVARAQGHSASSATASDGPAAHDPVPGHIINMGSVAGRWTYPGGGVYCASKAAVAALSEGLRMDLLGTGVRVTNIEPGLVETEFSQVRFGGDTDRAAAVYADTVPLTADDVAETVLWCLSRPARVNVQELVLFPTDQASVRDVHRA